MDKLSEILRQDNASGDFGKALEGYAERAEALEQEVERLKTKSMNLVDAVENNDDLPPIKYALRCRRLVHEIRSLCGKTLTPALHKEGES